MNDNLMKKLVSIAVVFGAVFALAGVAAAQSASAAAKEYRRLNALSNALKKIPAGKDDREPHRSFLKRNDKDIVYSEPSARWYVRSERYWDLRKRNASLAIADDIAWTAAENPLPGECEGYVNCHLFAIRMTHAEYLRLFPAGKYSAKAVKKLIEYQEYMAEDAARTEQNYTGPTDDPDREDLRKLIGEMRAIVQKLTDVRKQRALEQLDLIQRTFGK